jgi:hypothetical protein
MDSRAQVLTAYQSFATMVHTQSDSSIHVFHTDSAEAYLSCTPRQFLFEHGTLPQYLCTDAHAQNGVAIGISIVTFLRLFGHCYWPDLLLDSGLKPCLLLFTL